MSFPTPELRYSFGLNGAGHLSEALAEARDPQSIAQPNGRRRTLAGAGGALLAPSRSRSASRKLSPVVLPADETVHPGQKTEWWYYAGRFTTEHTKRIFSFAYIVLKEEFVAGLPLVLGVVQLVAHDTGPLKVVTLARPLDAVYKAPHDGDAYRFHFQEALAPPWARRDNWSIRGQSGYYDLEMKAPYPMRLTTRPLSGALLPGNQGIMTYHGGGQMAFYLYTNLELRGTFQGEQVTGRAWVERQYGPAPIRSFSWKYLAIVLDDGRQIVAWRQSNSGASARPELVRGWLVSADGVTKPLDQLGLQILDTRFWGRYPIDSRVTSLGEPRLDLTVEAICDDQLIDPLLPWAPTWYEGACNVRGTVDGTPVTGWAMNELYNF